MKIEGDRVVFSSGRSAYANRGIIGLSPELEVSEGYDGGFNWPPYGYVAEERRLTADDMRELADYMIEQWTKFKATIGDITSS